MTSDNKQILFTVLDKDVELGVQMMIGFNLTDSEIIDLLTDYVFEKLTTFNSWSYHRAWNEYTEKTIILTQKILNLDIFYRLVRNFSMPSERWSDITAFALKSPFHEWEVSTNKSLQYCNDRFKGFSKKIVDHLIRHTIKQYLASNQQNFQNMNSIVSKIINSAQENPTPFTVDTLLQDFKGKRDEVDAYINDCLTAIRKECIVTEQPSDSPEMYGAVGQMFIATKKQ